MYRISVNNRDHTNDCVGPRKIEYILSNPPLCISSNPASQELFNHNTLIIFIMKVLYIPQIIILGLAFIERALAGCECFWEGTAPFCNANCPSGTTATGRYSSSGGGAPCWTGRKQQCMRCGPNIPEKPCCIPKMTCAQCIGPIMICHEMFSNIPPISCGSHVCGLCTGSIPNICPSNIKQWEPPLRNEL